MFAQNKNLKRETLAAILIAVAFSVCVFSSGGFYWQSVIPVYFLLAVSSVLLRDRICLSSFFAFCSATLICILSLLGTAGDLQTGLHEVQKTLLFFATLPIGMALRRDDIIQKLLFYTAFAVALLGFTAYCSILPIDGFVFYDRSIYRLQSVFGYANTAATFLGCGYFAFLQSCKAPQKAYTLSLGTCILLAFYLTFSKACIPLFLIIGTIYIWKTPAVRSLFVLQNLCTAVAAVAIVLCVKNGAGLLAAILGFAYFAFSFTFRRPNRPVYFKIWLLSAAIAGICFATLLLRGNQLSTLSLRFAYMQDALPLLRKKPLLGAGPASWRILQYSMQTSAYSATHIHNGFLEFAAENGIPFALLSIAILSTGLILAWKRKMYFPFSVLALLSLHACIDCDLSFSSILILFGLTVGIILAPTDMATTPKHTVSAAGIALAAAFCICGSYMSLEYGLRNAMENAYSDGDYSQAYTYAERLEQIAPRDSRLQTTIAAIEEKRGASQEAILHRLSRATALSPQDAGIFRDYMQYACLQGDLQKLCRKYMDMIPYQETTYSFLLALVDRELRSSRLSTTEADTLRDEIEAERIKNNVIDRNDLLYTIVGKQ